MRWVERYKNEGNVNIHYRKPVAYKVKKEYVKCVSLNIKSISWNHIKIKIMNVKKIKMNEKI